jgi:hypothetical protein
MPPKKKTPAPKAETTYKAPPVPVEPLIVPATSVPEKVEKVAEAKSHLVSNIPAHGKGGINGRRVCDSCGFVMAKGAAYCPINPDLCKAEKGNG